MKKHITIVFAINFLSFACWSPCFAQKRSSEDDRRTIRIPVVIHVVYNSEVANISTELLKQEIEIMNEDFSGRADISALHERYKKRMGNPNIQFHLADTLLQDQGESGILRIHTMEADLQPLDLPKISASIKPLEYLNLYIGEMNSSATKMLTKKNNHLAFPKVKYSRIGMDTNGTKYHSTTHEVGHWLGLYHTWAKATKCGVQAGFLFPFGDGIRDTPLQFLCTDHSYKKKCRDRSILRKNYNNFMDYSSCRCMFTKKQAIRMRNTLIKERPGIYNASN